MSLNAEHPPIVSIHAHYCHLTSFNLSLNFERERNWQDWLKFGWTPETLTFVVNCIRRKISVGHRRPESLMFRNLIANTGRFEDDLANFTSQSKAEARKQRRDPERDSVLRATGRLVENKSEARSVAQILADEKALADFRAWKAKNL